MIPRLFCILPVFLLMLPGSVPCAGIETIPGGTGDSMESEDDPPPEHRSAGGETDEDEPDSEEAGSEDASGEDEEEKKREEDEGEGTGQSFLDAYYRSDEGGSCSVPGCSDFSDIIRIVAAVRVSYRSNPVGDGGSRVILGSGGNAAALDMRFCPWYFGNGIGYSGSLMFRTPSPWVLETTYHRSEPDDEPGFSLLYAGLMSQLVFDSPLQLMVGGHMVFPWEDGRETLAGGGAGLAGCIQLMPGFAVEIDYRLSWVRSLPLHRGRLMAVWMNPPMEVGAGYILLRNSSGEVIQGPCIGFGLFF
ncbi:MAG: hypothetical protein JXA64_07670 [Candidatus Fermentibacteraceae bacterium]|nr:hypothetical protein [Candidatus Fermentibacteraceae bacterium]MBN2608977.1 hypothetical protein [Candidatus Fermentibacteraceae bacterium]